MKTYVVIHHSLTPDLAQTMSWDDIRRYHVENNGWADIGYHAGVERIEGSLQWLAGRPMLARAAAARGMNRDGFHVMFTGNFDKAEPDEEMLRFGARHLADICELFAIPTERVIGHRDVAGYDWKSCPGSRFDLERLRKLIEGES